MKNRFIDRLYLFLFLLLGLALVVKHQVNAQGVGKGLTVIPPKFELFANPGDTVSEKIRVRNDSDFPVTYQVLVEDFTSSGEEGAVTLEETAPTTSFTLANWIQPDTKEFVLQPQEESSFTFSISVPKDAEPGGHYASILFSSGGDPVPGAASVASRVGNLVLLRVSGNVTEKATIESFDTPSYSQKGPIVFSLRLKNDGNVHIRPKGTIVITNLFNQKVAELPLQGANVLPGAVRKMDTTWDTQNPIGVFNATLVATYGQQNIPLTAVTRFTAISPVAAGLGLVAIIALILILTSLITGRKRFKKALKAFTDNS